MARFDGGRMSSDGGVILVKQADDILGLSRRFAACFRDKRHPGFVDTGLKTLSVSGSWAWHWAMKISMITMPCGMT